MSEMTLKVTTKKPPVNPVLFEIMTRKTIVWKEYPYDSNSKDKPVSDLKKIKKLKTIEDLF